MRTGRVCRWAAAAAAIGVGLQAGAVEVRTTVLVKSGDPIPALGEGFTWQAIHAGIADHVINDAGDVAFSGVIAGPGVDSTNSIVLMAGRVGGPYRVVARGGTAAPGLPAGVTIYQPVYPYLSETGRVFFYSTVTGSGVTTSNDASLWLESDPPGGMPQLVLREGDPAPGYPGLTISTFDVRTVAFQPRFQVIGMVATLAGPGVTGTNASVLYQSSIAAPGVLTPLARAGDLIPNQVGVSYGTFGGACFPGGANSIDFVARTGLAGAGITTSNDGALLLFQPGQLGAGVVVREGSAIPGQAVGTYNQMLGAYALPNGDMSYFATVSGLTTPNGATWIGSRLGGSGGNPRPLALRGTPVSGGGLPADAIAASAVIDKYDVASSGRAAFSVTCAGTGITTTNDTAIFTEGPGGAGVSTLIAREAAVPPGLAAPSAFANMAALFNSVAINARHQTAFYAYAPGVGTADPTSDTGLWIADASGSVQLVAHRALPFALTAADVRTPSLLGYRVISSPQLPARRWFLDDGRLITSMFFSDGSSALLLLHVDPPPPPCRADFNGDGQRTLQDLFDFLFAWFAQQPSADMNGIDGVTVQDLFDFLGLWFGGCP